MNSEKMTPPLQENQTEHTHSSEENGGAPVLLSPNEASVIYHTKNLYPAVRHIMLVVCVLFFIVLTLFLVHQNGKSIYDNGI